MDKLSHIHSDLAIFDLGTAKEYLEGMINGEYTGPHRTYASNMDCATGFFHKNVWRELPTAKKVKEEYIPLLKKARNSIGINDTIEIKKHNPAATRSNVDYPKYAMHVKACISSRIKNLERYCKGLNSDTESCIKEVEKERKYQFIRD